MSLADELATRSTGCERVAKKNETYATVIHVGVVLSSAAATIVAAIGVSNELSATLAAVPGALGLTIATFKFDARSQWWNAKAHRLDAFRRALLYEDSSKAHISKQLSEFLLAHERRYPGPGRPPSDSAA